MMTGQGEKKSNHVPKGKQTFDAFGAAAGKEGRHCGGHSHYHCYRNTTTSDDLSITKTVAQVHISSPSVGRGIQVSVAISKIWWILKPKLEYKTQIPSDPSPKRLPRMPCQLQIHNLKARSDYGCEYGPRIFFVESMAIWLWKWIEFSKIANWDSNLPHQPRFIGNSHRLLIQGD